MGYPDVSQVAKMGSQEVRDVLRRHRREPSRESELVVRCGQRALSMTGLGDERYQVLEQTAISALDIGEFKLAEKCILELANKFGAESRRVMRLKGILHEAYGDFSAANEFYNRILEKNPADKLAMWRKVAMLKAQGKSEEAIKEIEDFLKICQVPEEGYSELMNLHLAAKSPNYDKAATNCEELILQNPACYAWLMLYAEIIYSNSRTKSSFTLARKYFSEAICANEGPNNLRSVWGLWQTCKSLKALGLSGTEASENDALLDWATARLKSRYSKAGGAPEKHALLILG